MPKCLALKHAATIGPTGEVRPCCAWQAEQTDVTISDDWAELHNTYYEKSLDNWLPECIECKQDEELNGKSYRLYMNDILSDSIGIEHWDLKINNTCNLTCVSCGSHSSSSWAAISDEKARDTGWHKNIDSVLSDLHFAKIIKFTGGEPFLIPQVKKIIKYLIDVDIAPAIELQFITNGTIDISPYYDLFKSFKCVILTVSIDAVGERFEYIRRGASWEQVSNNIIDIQSRSPENTSISITCLPSILNINNIHEVSEWAVDHGIHFNRASDLISPAFMAPGALAEMKNKNNFIDHVMILDDRDGKDYTQWI